MIRQYTMKRFYLAMVLIVSLVLPGCSFNGSNKSTLRAIKYLVIKKQLPAKRRKFSGLSQFAVESNLSFQVSGQIKKLSVKLGEIVKKGQVIAQLDDDDFRSNLESAKSEYEFAKEDLERLRSLYENQSISRQQFEEAKTTLDVRRARYKTAQEQLSYTILRSPVNGIVTKKYVNVHEFISPGQQIVKIEAESELEIEVGIPEIFINNVKLGDQVNVYFEAFPNRVFTGVIDKVGYALDRTTATFPVIVKVSTYNQAGFHSGMVADVEFILQEKTDEQPRILVPLVAVLADQNNNKFVWVYNPQTQRVSKRIVQVGATQGKEIFIIEGLEENEIIASAGAHYLEEGQKVTLLEE